MTENERNQRVPTNKDILNKIEGDRGAIIAELKHQSDLGKLRERENTHLQNLSAVKKVLEKFSPNTIFDLPSRIKNKNGQIETITRKVLIRQPTKPDQSIFDYQGRIYIESVSRDYKHSIGAISFAQETGLITRTDEEIKLNQEIIDQYQNQTLPQAPISK